MFLCISKWKYQQNNPFYSKVLCWIQLEGSVNGKKAQIDMIKMSDFFQRKEMNINENSNSLKINVILTNNMQMN